MNAKGSVTRHLEAQAGRTFTEAELIDGLNEDLRDAWIKPREFATGLGPQRIYASALSIDQVEEPLTEWIHEAFEFAPAMGKS